ncbi:hypothetical protein LINGRAHAP2_LOCUS23325, partial [Linum grandiflorum]
MTSLATHFSAALLLLPLGLRRLFTSSSLYLNNPSQFRSKGAQRLSFLQDMGMLSSS